MCPQNLSAEVLNPHVVMVLRGESLVRAESDGGQGLFSILPPRALLELNG